MICHIRLGKLSWCEAPYAKRHDLALLARQESVTLACSHLSKAKVDKMVYFLHQCGIDTARVVEGPCAQHGR